MDELIEKLSISVNPPKDSGTKLNLITLEDLFTFWNNSTDSQKIKNELKNLFSEDNLFKSFIESDFYKGKNADKMESILISSEIVQEVKDFFMTNFDHDFPEVIFSTKYESVVPVKLNNPKNIANVRQGIRKNNLKITRRLEALEKAKESLEMAKEIVAGRRPTPNLHTYMNQKPPSKLRDDTIYLFAVDVESFEKNHEIILELGWIIFDVKNQRFYNRHIIIKEYQHVRNYKYVPDHKDKFIFGKSEYLSEVEAKRALQKEIDTLAPNLAMICHGLSSELKYFQKMGLKLKHAYQFDTNELHHSLFNDHGKTISLVNLLNKYQIAGQFLHNAGNDAHFTLLAFLAMCGYSLPKPKVVSLEK